MRRNWFTAAIVICVLAIVVAAIAMRLSDDGSPTTEAAGQTAIHQTVGTQPS
ncbi:MAG TPA: hypothetical protein VMK83_02485 [Gaiellaceae bacterium]|nr:hypothetical protein [Gaiellaceae bacterium]